MTSFSVNSVWRIAKHTKDYRADDLSGGGAAFSGGRWNSEGSAVVYAGTSIALCALETLAHMGVDIHCKNRFLIRIDIPAYVWRKRKVLTPDKLPIAWLAEPAAMDSIKVGDNWLTACSEAVLLVPSVIVHEEFNALINPLHPDANKIRAEITRQYVYDPRLK